jgi:hypothetical protein
MLNRNRMSLCLLRALLPRVMTATEARRGLILLPIKCQCSCSGTRLQPDGDHPGDDPRFAGDRGSIPAAIPDLPGIGGPSPSPVPIGGSVPCTGRCPAVVNWRRQIGVGSRVETRFLEDSTPRRLFRLPFARPHMLRASGSVWSLVTVVCHIDLFERSQIHRQARRDMVLYIGGAVS